MLTVLSAARKAVARFTAVGAIVALAACDATLLPGVGGNDGPAIDPSAPVQVALLVPKSDSNAASVATSLERAAQLAVASLDGVRIDLRVYDTAGSAQQAAAQAQQAVNDGAKIIVGPLYGEAANAAGLAVLDEGVNVLSFSNNPTIAGGNVFVLGQTFNDTANRLLNYAGRSGKRTVAILHENNVGGQLGAAAITAAAPRNGVSVVATVPYDLNSQSLNAAVARVKTVTDSGAAQALFLTDNWDQGLSVALTVAPEQGINPAGTQYIGLSRWDTRPDGFSIPGVSGGWFAVPDRARAAAFEQRYEAAYGSKPHALAGLAFDGIAAVGALVKAGRRDALTAAALTQPAGFNGATGVFRLQNDGTSQRGLAVATVRNNQVVILDPAPGSFGGS